MKKMLFILVLVSLVTFSYAVKTVNVGGYLFPPFVEKKVSGNIEGLTLDIIEELNQMQDDYNFEFKLTSPKRRYQDMLSGKYDVIFFESIVWGWSDKPVSASKVFLKGGEVYITNSENGNQNYFNSLEGKSIVGILGFHYGFAGFNADEDFLKKAHNARMTSTHSGNILSIVNNRADIAVVTKSYILKYLNENPRIADRLLISDKYDQEYNHTVLVKDNGVIAVDVINSLLDQLKKTGRMNALLEKYGLK